MSESENNLKNDGPKFQNLNLPCQLKHSNSNVKSHITLKRFRCYLHEEGLGGLHFTLRLHGNFPARLGGLENIRMRIKLISSPASPFDCVYMENF